MELVYESTKIQFDSIPTIDMIMESMIEMLGEDQFFSHLIVDQQEIYEDPESYLVDCLDEIESIEMKAKNVTEFMNDVLLSALDYSQRAVVALPQLAHDFRQLPSSQNFNDFFHMLEGMEWLHQAVSLVDSFPDEIENRNQYKVISVYLEILAQKIQDAFTLRNYSLIASIIEKELISIYESIEEINQVLYVSQNREEWH